MTAEERLELTPRMKEAIAEMKALVTHRYPTAQFSMYEGEDPIGIYLLATVDADDLDEVVDLFLERMVELQVEEALPLFVIPERTPERNAAILAEADASRRARFGL